MRFTGPLGWILFIEVLVLASSTYCISENTIKNAGFVRQLEVYIVKALICLLNETD